MPTEVKVVVSAVDKTSAAFKAATARLEELSAKVKLRSGEMARAVTAPAAQLGAGLGGAAQVGGPGPLGQLKAMFGGSSQGALIAGTLMGGGAVMGLGIATRAFERLGQGVEAASVAFRLGQISHSQLISQLLSQVPVIGGVIEGFRAITSAVNGTAAAAAWAKLEMEALNVAAAGLARIETMRQATRIKADSTPGVQAREAVRLEFEGEMERIAKEGRADITGASYRERDKEVQKLLIWRYEELARIKRDEEKANAKAQEAARDKLISDVDRQWRKDEQRQREMRIKADENLMRRQELEADINEAALRAAGETLRADLAREDEVWRRRLRNADSEDERDLISARRQQSLDAIVADARKKHATDWRTEKEREADEDLRAGLERTARRPVTVGAVQVTAGYRGHAESAEANEAVRVQRDQLAVQREHNERLKEILVEFKRIASGEGFTLRV